MTTPQSLIFARLLNLLPFAAAMMACMPGSAHGTDFQPRTFAGAGLTMPYQLLIPPNYDATKKYPVVLFFHGAGERGNTNISQLARVARTFAAPAFEQAHPCFVIAPQCPIDLQWVEMDWGAASGVRPAQPSKAMQTALAILDSTEREFSIDHDRVYVAGVSMGGYGAWDCITRFPGRFAAGIACCGGGDESTVTTEVAHMPVWAFHSVDDKAVPVARTRNMIAAMRKLGGDPKYTEYQDRGHEVWDNGAAHEPALFDWLFSQSLALRGKTP